MKNARVLPINKQKDCQCTDKCLGYFTKTCKKIEEPKQKWDIDTCRYFDMEVGCEREKCICENQEPKQETLEEAAKENFKGEYVCNGVDIVPAWREGFVIGAKWQQERMYSEKEVIKILLARNADLGIICKTSKVVEFIKQFKNK